MTIQRILIAMAKIAHGDNISPVSKFKTLEEGCIEYPDGVWRIWYNCGHNTRMQIINFNKEKKCG